ncbi:MAG: hypothetical protein K5985_03750 [Lachnospiraceae bacterium]|nr:hypothetical protein [Lachnospiraceae bacterium]
MKSRTGGFALFSRKPVIIYLAFAFLMLAFCLMQAGVQSFWLDELSLLGTITKDKGLVDILMQYLRVDVTNLPLFPLAAALWYRLFPASDRIMLLLPSLAAAAGCVFSALAAEELFGKRAGVFTAALYAFSGSIITGCAMEFRAYAFMVFNVSLLLFVFFRRGLFLAGGLSAKARFGREFLFTVSLVLLLFTHYMGAVFVLFLGIAELVFVLSRKEKARSLIPYFISGALFSAWFILMFMNKEKSIGSFWPDKPTLPMLARMVRFLLSGRESLFILLLFAVFLIVFRLFSAFASGRPFGKALSGALILLWCSGGTVGLVFIYSAVINPAGGFFVNRYFFVILPALFILMGLGLKEGTDILSGGNRERALELAFVATAFIVCYLGLINYRGVREETGVSYEPFREAAQYLRETGGEELHAPGSAVVCSVNPRATAGFTEYYLRNGGRDTEIKSVSLQGEAPVSDLENCDTLFLVTVHRDLSDLPEEIRKYISDNFSGEVWNEDVCAGVLRREPQKARRKGEP